MVEVMDKCPTCGAQRKRKITNEKALVSFDPRAKGMLLEYTKGGVLERQIEMLTSCWVDDIFPNLEEIPEGGPLHIWEGRLVVCEDGGDDHYTRGKFRPLTEDEWASLKEGLPLFK